MRIAALSVSNFKRLSALDIEADRGLIILGGKNGAGKSSALDAITAALTGAGAIPDEPVKRGESKGEVVVTLDSGIVVKRTFTRREDGTFGGGLTITTADGMSPGKPQAWLDQRIGDLSCDPLAFLTAKPEVQAERLRKIAGVDTSMLDAKKRAAFEARTEIGRIGKIEVGALESMPAYLDAPAEMVEAATVTPSLVSASDIVAELAAADATAQARRDADRLVDDLTGVAGRKIAERDRLTAEAETLRRKIAEVEAAALLAAEEGARSTAAAANAADAALKIAVTDRAPITARLADVERVNAEAVANANAANATARREAEAVTAKVRANEARAKQAEKVAAGRAAYAAKTAELATLDAERTAMLAAATFPVAGLGFGADGGVTLNDLPLSQASGAEKMRVSMGIALAANPTVRVVLIRDASLLDEESMVLVCKLAEESDAQVWLERVGSGDAGVVVITDGGVA